MDQIRITTEGEVIAGAEVIGTITWCQPLLASFRAGDFAREGRCDHGAELARMESELEDLEEEHDSLRDEFDELRDDYDKLHADFARQEQELARLKAGVGSDAV